MALDGLNGFYYEGTPTGTPTLSGGTGFDFVPSRRQYFDELQTELTGKKKKYIPARKYSDGTINYRGITYANEEAFRIGNPGVQISNNVLQAEDAAYKFVRNKDGKYDVLDKEGKVVKTFDKKYQAKNAVRRYILGKGKQQKPFTPPFEQPTGQPTPQPKPATISFAANIAEATEADAMEALAKEQAQAITPEKRANLFAERQLAQTEADAMEALAKEQAQAISPQQRANLFAERQLAQTEADAMEALAREQAQIPQAARDEAVLAAEEAKIASKPQVVETPVVSEAPVTKKPYVAPEIKPASQEVKNALEAEVKGRKSFLKSGKGKAALVLGGLALVGAALFGLSTCEGDKKQQLPPANPEPEKKPEPKPQPEKPAQPVPPAQPEEPEKSEENQAQQPQFEEISVVKGSDEWKYAELELISEHLGQAGYRPTNQEITDRMMQIIEREKKALEEAKADDPEGKNRHSIPPLKEGDMLNVSPELKKVIDEATNELKEAHKDNPNYKVTWTELRAKVQEKLAA